MTTSAVSIQRNITGRPSCALLHAVYNEYRTKRLVLEAWKRLFSGPILIGDDI